MINIAIEGSMIMDHYYCCYCSKYWLNILNDHDRPYPKTAFRKALYLNQPGPKRGFPGGFSRLNSGKSGVPWPSQGDWFPSSRPVPRSQGAQAGSGQGGHGYIHGSIGDPTGVPRHRNGYGAPIIAHAVVAPLIVSDLAFLQLGTRGFNPWMVSPLLFCHAVAVDHFGVSGN